MISEKSCGGVIMSIEKHKQVNQAVKDEWANSIRNELQKRGIVSGL